MRSFFLFLAFFVFNFTFSQKILGGKVVNLAEFPVANVLVVNISSGQKTFTDSNGNFSITAKSGDELRFVEERFERRSFFVAENDFQIQILVVLQRLPYEIQPVKVGFKPSGNLKKDSKSLTKVDKAEQLEKEVGVPKGPAKPREKPAEVKKVLLPVLLGQLDVQGIYDLVSGKAKKQKRLYKYEDMSDHISWIRSRLDENYFAEIGIPKDKISEFLEFSILIKPEIKSYIKTDNLSGVTWKLEETRQIFLAKSKS